MRKKLLLFQASLVPSEQGIQRCCTVQSRQIRSPACSARRYHGSRFQSFGTVGKISGENLRETVSEKETLV